MKADTRNIYRILILSASLKAQQRHCVVVISDIGTVHIQGHFLNIRRQDKINNVETILVAGYYEKKFFY